MPIRRDAEGNIVEEKTERAGAFGREAEPDDPTGGKGPQPTPPAQPGGDAGPRVIPQQAGQQSGYEADTVPARSTSDAGQAAPAGAAEAVDATPERHTRIYRPGVKKSPTAERPPAPANAMDDPPVGWLVVVRGPGQGHVVTMGNGSNSLGRDPGERVCVDFGDETISRSGHAIITYDPQGQEVLHPARRRKKPDLYGRQPRPGPDRTPGLRQNTAGRNRTAVRAPVRRAV